MDDGARELDMVVNIGKVLSNDWALRRRRHRAPWSRRPTAGRRW